MKFFIKDEGKIKTDLYVRHEDNSLMYDVQLKGLTGNHISIFDAENAIEVATIKKTGLHLLTRIELSVNGLSTGTLEVAPELATPKYTFNFNGWNIEGNLLSGKYNIINESGQVVANVIKVDSSIRDYCIIDCVNDTDVLSISVIVIALNLFMVHQVEQTVRDRQHSTAVVNTAAAVSLANNLNNMNFF